MTIDEVGLVPGAGPVDERRFDLLLEISRDAFLEIDAVGTLTRWNHQAEVLLGWSAESVLGRNSLDFLVPERYRVNLTAEMETLRVFGFTGQRTIFRKLCLIHEAGHEIQTGGAVYIDGSSGEVRMGALIHDRSDERAAEEALAHAYLHDQLTGMPNRTLFTYHLAYALAKGHKTPGSVAVMILDLDRFKGINDGLGHEIGDEVLVAVASRLSECEGSAEIIARLGGDEFLILFDGEDAEAEAVAFAGRALVSLEDPFKVGGSEVFISASVGIASTSSKVLEATPLLSNADAAMYQAKQHGGNSTEVFGDAIRVKLLDRMSTEHSLHRALERCELRLFYQPVVNIHDDRAVAVEALIRWVHPDHGLVVPDRFIPVAEESGLIIPIGAWVLEQACGQLKAWQNGRWGGAGSSVEVNLSARQIDHPDIVATVQDILKQTGVSPANLTLEITESALMKDAAAALEVLWALKEQGVTLAIDDFGTGYSSLSYLQRFPLDILKVDKTFVDGLGRDAEATEIVSAVINLAHALGLEVIAEGVETERQLEELRRLGCDFAQGYLFSRPVPAEELMAKFPLRLGA